MIHFKLYRQSDRYTKWFDFRMQKPCALWHSWRKKSISTHSVIRLNILTVIKWIWPRFKWEKRRNDIYWRVKERNKKKTVDKGTLWFKCFYQRQIKWTPIIRFTYMEKRPSSLTTIKKGRWCDKCIFHRLCENKKNWNNRFAYWLKIPKWDYNGFNAHNTSLSLYFSILTVHYLIRLMKLLGTPKISVNLEIFDLKFTDIG